MAGAVRTPIGPDARLPTRRSLDERFYLRWPSLYAPLSRAVLSLPRRSRLRRALVSRAMLSGYGAWARGDLELTLLRYAPGYELKPLHEFLAVGIRSSYKGRAGVREWAAEQGLIAREVHFSDWDETLRAAGITKAVQQGREA